MPIDVPVDDNHVTMGRGPTTFDAREHFKRWGFAWTPSLKAWVLDYALTDDECRQLERQISAAGISTLELEIRRIKRSEVQEDDGCGE